MNKGTWHLVAQDLVAVWTMVTLAICAGLLINQLRDHPISLVHKSQAVQIVSASYSDQNPAPAQAGGAGLWASELSLQQFQGFVTQKEGLVLDARPEIFHRLGHVPGAISLPRDDFEAGYGRIKALLERDKNQWIAVYCAESSCQDSVMVRDRLVGLGYSHVAVFRGGWAEWSATGLPEEVAQ